MKPSLAPKGVACRRPSLFRRALYKALLLLKPVWRPLLARRVEFFGTSHTIGDMASGVEYYLMRRLERRSRVVSIYLVNKPSIANPYLARLQARTFADRRTIFVMNRPLCLFLEPLERELYFAGPTAHFTQHPAEYHQLTAKYDLHIERAVLAEERARARALMERLGLPRDAKFACVHAREAGFKAHLQPLGHNNFRDIDIGTYVPALEYLIGQGFWLVRMGEPTVKPLPPMRQVIDYARSGLKSDFLDILLLAECELLLGCNSGLSHIAHIFKKPGLWTNSVPIEMAPWDDFTLWIPKLVYSLDEHRYLTFAEIIGRGIGKFHWAQDYARERLEVHANSAEDILVATKELVAMYRNGRVTPPEARRMQEALNRAFPPHYLSYGARSRICAGFFLAHRDLLPFEADEPARLGAVAGGGDR